MGENKTNNLSEMLVVLLVACLTSDSKSMSEPSKSILHMLFANIADRYGISISGSDASQITATNQSGSDLVFGIRGLADLLHVSLPTAQKYKNAGVFDLAMHKIGHKYAWDKEIVLEIAKNSK